MQKFHFTKTLLLLFCLFISSFANARFNQVIWTAVFANAALMNNIVTQEYCTKHTSTVMTPFSTKNKSIKVWYGNIETSSS